MMRTCESLTQSKSAVSNHDRYSLVAASAYCKRTPQGREYVGTVSVTENGLPCQRWDSQFPHRHDFGDRPDDFPDGDVSDASNYCRNPDGQAAGLWCYTRDPQVKQENCGIPTCIGQCTAVCGRIELKIGE